MFSIATPDDAPQLVRLINIAYRFPRSTPGWTDERQLLSGPRISDQTIVSEFDTGRFLISKKGQNGAIDGCVHVAALDRRRWYISLLAVDPTIQAKGVGTALLTEVEKQALDMSAEFLRITVIEQRQQLLAWYERRGFQLIGETIPFPYDDTSVGVPLHADLRLVFLEKTLAPRPV